MTDLSSSPQIRHQSRSDEIAAILRDAILGGQYRPGERLPSERDLCDRFAVSRGAVREALKKLEQLGIASIQPGGARVVSIQSCTLDVLGPLLDLNPMPDPKLVDEVLQLFGTLMDLAARAAIERATDDDLEHAEAIVAEILADDSSDVRQHEAVRRLGEFYVDLADHLVLRLMINGLRTTFFERMHGLGIHLQLDGELLRDTVGKLRGALRARDSAAVGSAMKELNRLFRDSARVALRDATATQQRIPA